MFDAPALFAAHVLFALRRSLQDAGRVLVASAVRRSGLILPINPLALLQQTRFAWLRNMDGRRPMCQGRRWLPHLLARAPQRAPMGLHLAHNGIDCHTIKASDTELSSRLACGSHRGSARRLRGVHRARCELGVGWARRACLGASKRDDCCRHGRKHVQRTRSLSGPCMLQARADLLRDARPSSVSAGDRQAWRALIGVLPRVVLVAVRV